MKYVMSLSLLLNKKISFTEFNISQNSDFPANICSSGRRLQHVFGVTILRLPRHLEEEKLLR